MTSGKEKIEFILLTQSSTVKNILQDVSDALQCATYIGMDKSLIGEDALPRSTTLEDQGAVLSQMHNAGLLITTEP